MSLSIAAAQNVQTERSETSSIKKAKWRGKTLCKRDLFALERKLRSGKIVPYAPSRTQLPKRKKEITEKETTLNLNTGVALVKRLSDGKQVPIIIKKATYDRPEECFSALVPPENDAEDYRKIGHIAFSLLKIQPDAQYGSETCKGSHYKEYGNDHNSTLNRIFVSEILYYAKGSGEEEYKGVGTALMQAAFEWGLSNGTDGRLSLLAINNSHAFYYKLGMRAHYRHTEIHDQVIADEIDQAQKENREPNTQKKLRDIPHVGSAQGIYMYMPEAAIEKMKEKKANFPVFRPRDAI